MKAKLIGLGSIATEFRFVLSSLPTVVGRSPDADIRPDDRWVSRMHCQISEIQGMLTVRDLESKNGTAVNGEYVTEAHLLPGDKLTVGLTSFEVQYPRRKTSVSVSDEEEATIQS
jgi:pSer/pThr/pTyr-binding forkhead associated (FHA) protein